MFSNVNQEHLNKVGAIMSIDPKYLDDELSYRPSTHYSVTLDFQKEYIRHKRVLCSIREFKNLNIQSEWDVSYCQNFCHNGNLSQIARWDSNVQKVIDDPQMEAQLTRPLPCPQDQLIGEQLVDKQSKDTYKEYYQDEEEIRQSVQHILQAQLADSYLGKENKFLAEDSRVFISHTSDLIEGYKNPETKNRGGFGLNDFNKKMVLRFKNEHETSLYFSAVDQLTEIIILKGRRVLLEKENYHTIMSKMMKLSKDFLFFLTKDEAYGDLKELQEAGINDPIVDFIQQDNTNLDDVHNFVEYIIQKQNIRFMRRDTEHRSFIRGYLFDLIFKIYF